GGAARGGARGGTGARGAGAAGSGRAGARGASKARAGSRAGAVGGGQAGRNKKDEDHQDDEFVLEEQDWLDDESTAPGVLG
ncbi:hypothetical protein, partial [Nocardioides sp.]|uniref:hypothetical protein n=1 Tax=Nocardioides sp. TaxID=35761 RepID=UPI0031FE472E|nr:hypothetical protein [Nocardioides sp.]